MLRKGYYVIRSINLVGLLVQIYLGNQGFFRGQNSSRLGLGNTYMRFKFVLRENSRAIDFVQPSYTFVTGRLVKVIKRHCTLSLSMTLLPPLSTMKTESF